MVPWIENPVVNAGLLLAWAGVTLGALYRHRRGDWPRSRAVLFVTMATGWSVQSVDDAAPLLGLGPLGTDLLFAAFSLAFVAGLGYPVFLWRRDGN